MPIWIAGFLCAAAAIAVSLPADAAPADARFKAIYTREWAWREQQFTGEDADDDQKPLADHLPKVDATTQTVRLRHWQDVMHELDAISPSSLSRDEQINYAVYRPQIQILIN